MRPALALIALLAIGGCKKQQEVVSPTKAQTITVYRTKTGKKYHDDGCQHLRRSQIAIRLDRAVKVYGPCSKCDPPIVK